jgi:hypothetical protein
LRFRLASCAAVVLTAPSGCTTWTSLHGGYGLTPTGDRPVAGIEVRRAVGTSIHSGYGMVGARLDAGRHQFDAEAHVGVMRPVRLSEKVTFAPSVTLEVARIGSLAGSWYGGAFGPGVGAEFLWWLRTERRTYEAGTPLGCMGGAVGFDCPSGCQVQDVIRDGIGIRVAAEYDIRLDSSYPRMNDWVLWLTVGMTRAVSRREKECCYFERTPPLRRDCTLAP